MDVCLEADRPVAVGATAARARFDGPRCASCRERLPRAVATPATEGETSVPHLDRDLPPPTRFGRYVFAGEIGAGGMGVVYAARDLRHHTDRHRDHRSDHGIQSRVDAAGLETAPHGRKHQREMPALEALDQALETR